MRTDAAALIVFGANGQLGRALTALAPPAGWRRLAFGEAGADVTDPDAVSAAMSGVDYGVVVNASAYTAVDRAESERALAFKVNGEAPGMIAAEAGRRGLAMVHISTDFVFDGEASAPYSEEDPPNPLSVYGASKLAGELTVADANPRHVVLRTAWLFSAHAACFPRTIVKLLRQRDEVRVVDDQRGCPTPADGLARAILAIAPALAEAPAGDPRFGLFHLCGEEAVSRFAFAQALADEAARQGLKVGRVLPCATDRAAAPARRPANAALSCARIGAVHAVAPLDWRAVLPACVKAYEDET
jgi:dTDP-4-dehydrorhamnose reductase